MDLNKCGIHCLSWSAVIVGAFVAIGLGFLFNLFSLSAGLTAYLHVAEGKTVIAGGFILMVVGVMISMFIAGWSTGFLGAENCSNRCFGILYGFVTWCVALAISIFLTANVGQFIAIQRGSLIQNDVILKIAGGPVAKDTNESAATGRGQNVQHELAGLTEQESKTAEKTLFLTFLLFLVGAVMSSFGGYIGIKYRKNEK